LSWREDGWVACGETGCHLADGTAVPSPCAVEDGCLAADGQARVVAGALLVNGVAVAGGATSGPVRVADDGVSVWLADDQGLRRWDGSWTAVATGPVTGLVAAPGGAWWRDGSGWHGAAAPPPLLGGIEAGDGGPGGVWFVHDGLLGWTSGLSPEEGWPLEDAVVAVDGDRVVVASGTTAWTRPSSPAAPSADPVLVTDASPAIPEPNAAPPAVGPAPALRHRPPVGALATAWNVRPDGTTPTSYEVSLDLGLLAGSALGPQRGIGGSPYGAIGITPHIGRVAWWTGLSSAPLFIQAADVVVVPLAMLDVGLDAGGAHLRAGPFASAGLLAAAVGLRGRALPIRLPNGAWSGVEARVTLWTGPDQGVDSPAEAFVGSASLAWSGQFALGDRQPDLGVSDAPLCARLGIGGGAVFGRSDASRSWERIGGDDPWQDSVSPVVTAWCETEGTVALWISADTAPFFEWRAPDADGDVALRWWGAASAGPTFGTEGFRAGAIASAGAWMAGLGGRVWGALPATGRPRTGLDARALWLAPAGNAWVVTAAATLSFDPRRAP
jgi:hypothetical protein